MRTSTDIVTFFVSGYLKQQDMADGGHDGAERDAEGTDQLLYTDLSDNTNVFGLNPPPLKLDHCDLLLDAIDAQLGQLQVQPQKCQAISREFDCTDSAPLKWSQSLSKDTGLGSTAQTNDTSMSCLDLICTPTMEKTSDKSAGCRDDPVNHEETKPKLERGTKQKEDIESQRQQTIWRLERLLGGNCGEGRMAGETYPSSDSICTEDFVSCFRNEMVESALSETNVQQLDKAEETERAKITDYDPCQHQQEGQSVLDVDGKGTAMTTETARVQELEKCHSDDYGINTTGRERARAGERYETPQRIGDGSVRHRTEVIIEQEIQRENTNLSPKARSLAGVPLWSFDTVSIDSDLDSVSTEQVRQHIHRQSGWRALIQSVQDMDDYDTNQSDSETPTQEENEPQSKSGRISSHGNAQNRTHSKRQRNKRETHRPICSLGDKDTDEEINHHSRRCRPKRTLEKIQSDWFKMNNRLSTLQQKCEKEDERLQNKKTQIKDVELCLSDLQQRRKNALLELEQMSAETAKMEKEKTTLKFFLRDSKTGKDAASGQQHELQKQRKSCILEPSVVMSVLEREEMDRQLDRAKHELFVEQRHAREKLESMQEELEETREELQRVTEAESLLRSRCSCLEEKQRREKDQIEAAEFQVGELQREFRECKVRIDTLERMLAKKDLQLLDLQEQCGALQAERDGLKGELQHLKTQQCTALKEAQDKTHRMMEAALKQQKKLLSLAHEQQIQKVSKQTEEEKANALREQALSTKLHIESLKSSFLLKEEETKKLRDSLERLKQEAKSHEAEVKKAIEEERRKWEVEKVEAVQENSEMLDEQNKEILESMRSEMQEEKSKALALQHKVVELKKRVQGLKSESCAQQKEQESLLAVIFKSLKEEHQAELQNLQRQMAQDSQRVVLRHEQSVQLAEKEADSLREMLAEKESSHKQITAEMEQQLQHCTQELQAECQNLHLLVEQSGAKQSAVQLPPSPTIPEALTNLRTQREKLKNMMSHLHQELESQKQTTEDIKNEKERELSIQRQLMKIERDQALKSLKKRLIQEHIEELSSLKCAHPCDGVAEGGGVVASLRKQLKAKDMELKQVQRSMGQWKEQTAARLACKFEEELTAELERCKTKLLRCRKTLKTQEEKWTKSERPKGEMTLSTRGFPNSVCSPSLYVAASCSPSDVASLKLLHYLQGRVKRLRVENQACHLPIQSL